MSENDEVEWNRCQAPQLSMLESTGSLQVELNEKFRRSLRQLVRDKVRAAAAYAILRILASAPEMARADILLALRLSEDWLREQKVEKGKSWFECLGEVPRTPFIIGRYMLPR